MKNLEFLNDSTVPKKSASNIASPNQIKELMEIVAISCQLHHHFQQRGINE